MKIAIVEKPNYNFVDLINDGEYWFIFPDGERISPVYAGFVGAHFNLYDVLFEPKPSYLYSISIGANAGINYTNNDVLTLSSGTNVGNVGQVKVASIGPNGSVTSLIIANSGYYTSNPDEVDYPTGGTGSGLEINVDMASYKVANAVYVYDANASIVIETNIYETPVIDNTISIEIQRQDSLTADISNINLKDKLKNATSQQIDTWIQNNVTNLAEARVVLGAIVKFLANRFNNIE